MPVAKQKHTTQWLRQRTIGQNQINKKPNSRESIERLQLENVLEGHLGCVNCLEWNRTGDLLASGSDDRNVIFWHPFKSSQQRSAIIPTGHQGTIFSVKFIPESCDSLIATCAGDFGVRVTNSITGENILNCNLCHTNRVKRLEVHPNEPNLVWSAAEDGFIMQYDLREEHSCKPNMKPKNLLIDLKSNPNLSVKGAKCLAIHPVRDEMLAVGSDDVYVRLFDRRFMRQSGWASCTAHFSPGHLSKQFSNLKSPTNSYAHSLGTTYLTFSPDGQELLVNFHGEHVYLFNVHEPWERYKSFEITAKPLILDLPIPIIPDRFTKNRKTYSQWRELRKLTSKEIIHLPKDYREYYDKLIKKISSITLEDYDTLNILISETNNCPELYHLRAAALIQRGWRGDYYQAIRDCCCALALKPLDHKALEKLGYASWFLNDRDALKGMIDMMKILQSECGTLNDTITTPLSCHSSIESAPDWIRGVTQIDSNGQLIPLEVYDLMDDADPMDHDYIENEDQTMSTEGNSLRERLVSMMMDINSPLSYQKQPLEWSNTNQCSVEAFDYSKRFCGHCNLNTDIKEVNFFGSDGEFVIGGSDDGAFYIWDKETTNIVKAVHGDLQILNCLQSHPSIYMLATSGIESTVKLWSPSGSTNYDVKSLDIRLAQNQNFINSDPLESMMMMMLYPNRYI